MKSSLFSLPPFTKKAERSLEGNNSLVPPSTFGTSSRMRKEGGFLCWYKYLQTVIFSLFFANIVPAGEPQKGFATLDWTVAETLLALGEKPVAVGDVATYQKWVVEPKLPDDVRDLGIRLQPNPEQIATLSHSLEAQPLHFINSVFYASATPMLKQFTDLVDVVDFYGNDGGESDVWQNVLKATQKIAELSDRQTKFTVLKQRFLQKIDGIRPLVKPYTNRPVALVQFIDSRHLRIYATNSLFGSVLKQLGFENAWNGSHNQWGFETIEVTQLMKLPQNSRFVVIKPYPSNIKNAMQYNVLWQHLAMAKDPLILPTVWTFGGIPSAQRFAEVLANGLLQGGEKW